MRSGPVTCRSCGQEWPRDPALEVPCPDCQAPVGKWCKRPSGHGGNFVDLHRSRDQAALDAGVLQRCPAAELSAESVAQVAVRKAELAEPAQFDLFGAAQGPSEDWN